MKNLLASWFRSLTAFDNTPVKQEFSIVDPTSADPKGLNTVTLAVSPSDGQSPTMVSLYFEASGVKLFEKQYQDDQDAQTELSAMAQDLNEAATLSKEGKIDEAKNLVSSLIEKYKRHSDTLVQPTPTRTMTQASQEPLQYKGFKLKKLEDGSWQASQDELAFRADSLDSVKAKVDNMLRKAYGKKLAKSAAITMQNLFFDTADEAMEYQEKMKTLQGPEGSSEGKPLWEQMGNGNEEVAPSNETAPEEDNELAPPSLSFDRIEKDKAKTDKDIGKRIKDQVKTEVESALEQKSASVFGTDQEELVEALRKNGRNWDEIKKIFTKELSYNEDDTTVFLDSIRAKEEGGASEGLPLPPKPPEDLVSPETHDKLIKEIENKTDTKPEPELNDLHSAKVNMHVCPKCGIDWECTDPKCKREKDLCAKCFETSKESEIARADNTEIRKVATKKVALQLWERASNYMGDDLSDYYMGPAIGYEKEPLEVSNFNVALKMLGGEGNGVLVGSFGGFGGGYEQIFVHKDAADKVAILEDIENKLQNYPVLDDDDYSEREMEAQRESYESWAKPDALRIIDEELHRQNPDLQGSVSELELSPEINNQLANVVFDDLAYGDGTALNPKHLLQEAEEAGLLNSLRNKLEGKEAAPENPNQMKLFETSLKHKLLIKALHKRALNPLQEPPAIGQAPSQPLSSPVEENPTFDSPVPAAPEANPEPEFLEAPQAGDRVYVMGDYETGEDGYEGTMVSDYTSKGDEYAVISKDDGDNAEVALHRVVKASQKKVAQVYYEKVAGPVYCKNSDCNRKATIRRPDGNWCEKHAPAYEKKAEHVHEYRKSRPSSTVEICPCGRFRFTEEYLKTHPPIVEKKADETPKGKFPFGHVRVDEDAASRSEKIFSETGGDIEIVKKEPEKEADLEVESKGNEDVIRMFINDSFPKDKMPVWGTANLKISKMPNGWALVNYQTPILYRANGSDVVVFNTHKYSVTTSKIQSQIRRNFAGQPVKETDEAGIHSAIDQSNIATPEPETNPELQSLHESALKLQAELEREGEIAIYFHKEGIEKQAAGDSAFEANGWCRVWIQDTEIESDKRYPEILKLADETVRVDALKDLARELAHEALRLADSAASKVGVQAWFESLHPSDHDRIDWDALANPTQENVESAQNPKIEKKAEYPGGPCAGCGKELPTVWGATFCKECVDKGLDKKHFEKKAADPVPAPEIPVTYKELQKAPPYTDRSKALPANQEQVEVAKNLQISMASIESIKDLVKRVKADLEKRILALQQAGGLSQLEEEKKKQVDQLSALINATENKLISYGEHLYGYSEQTKKVGPILTDAWRVEKLVEKFAGAAEYLKAAEAGAQNMAKEVTTKTLTKFPKLSRLDKQAGFLDSLNDVYSNVLEALKLIIGSDEPAVV
jgi:hypothetical protein